MVHRGGTRTTTRSDNLLDAVLETYAATLADKANANRTVVERYDSRLSRAVSVHELARLCGGDQPELLPGALKDAAICAAGVLGAPPTAPQRKIRDSREAHH